MSNKKDSLGDKIGDLMTQKQKSKDDLGNRMKEFYEDRFRYKLPRRTNVLIRIDGKAFHTYTRGLNKPYDGGLMEDMNETTKYLCENIQGAKMGYVQSDEISILITDYDDISTSAWFDNNIQKMCSIAASLATAQFNKLRMIRIANRSVQTGDSKSLPDHVDNFIYPTLALFDARIFIIPHVDEVVNYFIWRQQDATRNSISMAAQSQFSHGTLNGVKCEQMQEMLFTEKGINWNDYPVRFKRGAAVIKEKQFFKKLSNDKVPGTLISYEDYLEASKNQDFTAYERAGWKIDTEIPIFTQEKEYIVRLMPGKN